MKRLIRTAQYQLIPVKPITGVFDARSLPDDVGAGSFRLVQNFSVRAVNKRCRRGGWIKLFDRTPYPNSDLHDQLNSGATNLQEYYYSYTARLIGGGEFDHYTYFYYAPDEMFASTNMTVASGGYCGYAQTTEGLFGSELNPGGNYPAIPSPGFGIDGMGPYAIIGLVIGETYRYVKGVNEGSAVDGSSIWNTSGDYIATTTEVHIHGTSSNIPITFSLKTFLSLSIGFEKDSCFIYDWFSGVPYNYIAPFNSCITTVGPTDFQGSYFYVACSESMEAYTIPGYPYGQYIGVYDPTFDYSYTYCGNVPLLRGGCNEAITYLSEFRSPRNFRKLIAGTKSRLYSLNEKTGNWRILADGLGGSVDPATDCDTCSQRRFMSAQMDAILLLTNDFNPPLYFYWDDTASGCDLWSVQVIQDLEDLNVTKAGCVAVHRGFVFWGDLEQDGEYFPNRVIWSDFKQPISYLPTSDSLAGFQDIGSGEQILNMQPLGDYLYIYTDQAIHRCSLVASEEVFNFEQVYRGKDAMKFKHSLVNTGDEHLYWAEDKIMMMTLADANPIEVPWMRATSSVIFDGINEIDASYLPVNGEVCNLVSGGYNANFREVFWSWPSGDNTCPDVTLVFNLTTRQFAADLVDHGFTAFCLYESDQMETIMEWLNDQKICTVQELISSLVKEGLPLDTTSTFTDAPTSIWNATEDPDLPKDNDSVCGRLQTIFLDDICKGCPGEKVFVMASASDYCLKSYEDQVFYRERLDALRTTYLQEGFKSVLQSGAESLKIDDEKNLSEIKVQYKADLQTTPNLLYCWAGFGAEANCLEWKLLRNVIPDNTINDGVELRCLTDLDVAQHTAQGIRSSLDAHFHASMRGRFLSYKLIVQGTGGGSCYSDVRMRIAQSQFS